MWLKFGVVLSGELTSIDEVVRGKTNLAYLYCGCSLTAKKGSVKEHHFAHTEETGKPVSQGIKTKLSHRFPSRAILNDFLCVSILTYIGEIKFMFISKKLKQKFDHLKKFT